MANNSTMLLSQTVDPAIMLLFDETKNEITKSALYKAFPTRDWEIESSGDKLSSLTGFGPGQLTMEGETYATDYIYQGYSKTLQYRKYTKRIPITEELEYFLKRKSRMGASSLESWTRSAAKGLLLNWEQDFAKLFYLGAGTTFITGGDSLALFSASHTSTKPGLAVQSNIITVGGVTNPVLNADSLQAAFVQLDRLKSNSGTLMSPTTRAALIVGRKHYEKAMRLKYSEYGPDTANLGYGLVSPTVRNATGKSFEVYALHHMTDAYADYWFVVDMDRMEEMVVRAYMWEPRVHERMFDIDGVRNILASTMFGFNPIDWRWVVGSTGVNPTP